MKVRKKRTVSKFLSMALILSMCMGTVSFASEVGGPVQETPVQEQNAEVPETVPQEVPATYTVRWLDMNEEELAHEVREGIAGQQASVKPEDLLALNEYGFAFRNDDERNVQTGTITEDNGLELKLYFDAIEQKSAEEESVSPDASISNEQEPSTEKPAEEHIDENAADDAAVEDKGMENSNEEVTYMVEWRDSFNVLLQSETRTAKAGEEVTVTEEDKEFDSTFRYFFDEEVELNVLSGIAEEGLVLVMYFQDTQASSIMNVGDNNFYFMIDMRPYGGQIYTNVRHDIYPSAEFMSMYDKFNWAAVDKLWDYQFAYYWSDWGDSPAGKTTPGYGTFYSQNKESKTGCRWYFGWPKLDGISERTIHWMPAFVDGSVQPKSGFRVDGKIVGDYEKIFTGNTIACDPSINDYRDILESSSTAFQNELKNKYYTYTFVGYEIVSGSGDLSGDSYAPGDGYSVVNCVYSAEAESSVQVDLEVEGEFGRRYTGESVVFDINEDLPVTKVSDIISKKIKQMISSDSYVFKNIRVESGNIQLSGDGLLSTFIPCAGKSCIVLSYENLSNVKTANVTLRYVDDTGKFPSYEKVQSSVPVMSMFYIDTKVPYGAKWDLASYSNEAVLQNITLVEGNAQINDGCLRFLSDEDIVIELHYDLLVSSDEQDRSIRVNYYVDNYEELGMKSKKLSYTFILDHNATNKGSSYHIPVKPAWDFIKGKYDSSPYSVEFVKLGNSNYSRISDYNETDPTKLYIYSPQGFPATYTIDINGSPCYISADYNPHDMHIRLIPSGLLKVNTVITGQQQSTKTVIQAFNEKSSFLLSDFVDRSDFDSDVFSYEFKGYTVESGTGNVSGSSEFDSSYNAELESVVINANYEATAECSFVVNERIVGDFEGFYEGSALGVLRDDDKNFSLESRLPVKLGDVCKNLNDYNYVFEGYIVESGSCKLSDSSDLACNISNVKDDVIIVAQYRFTSKYGSSHIIVDYVSDGDVTASGTIDYGKFVTLKSTCNVLNEDRLKDLFPEWYGVKGKTVEVNSISILSGDADTSMDGTVRPISEGDIRIKVSFKVWDTVSMSQRLFVFRAWVDDKQVWLNKSFLTVGVDTMFDETVEALDVSIKGLYPTAEYNHTTCDFLSGGVTSNTTTSREVWIKAENTVIGSVSYCDFYWTTGANNENINFYGGWDITGLQSLSYENSSIPLKRSSTIVLNRYIPKCYAFDTDMYDYEFIGYTEVEGAFGTFSNKNSIDSNYTLPNRNYISVHAKYKASYASTVNINVNIYGEQNVVKKVDAIHQRIGSTIDVKDKSQSKLGNEYIYVFEGYDVSDESGEWQFDDEDLSYSVIHGVTTITAKYRAVKPSEIRVDINITGDYETTIIGDVTKFNSENMTELSIKDHFLIPDDDSWNFTFVNYTLQEGHGSILGADNLDAKYNFSESFDDNIVIVANYTATRLGELYYLYYDTSGYKYATDEVFVKPTVSVDGNFVVTDEVPDPGNDGVFDHWENESGNVYHAGDEYHSDEKVSWLHAKYTLKRTTNFHYLCGSRLIFEGDPSKYILGDVWNAGSISSGRSSTSWNTSPFVVLDKVMPQYDESLFDKYSDMYSFLPVDGYYIHEYTLYNSSVEDNRRLNIKTISGGSSYYLYRPNDSGYTSTFDLTWPVYAFAYAGYDDGGLNSSIDDPISATFVQDYNAIPFANKVNVETKFSGDLDITNVESDIIMRFDERYKLSNYVTKEFDPGYDYRFLGYSVKIGEGTIVAADSLNSAEFSPITKPYEGKIVVQALFEATKKPELTYDTKGGSAVDPTYPEDGRFMVTRRVPTKEDYVFKGWSISEAATDVDYIGGDTLSGSKDRTLYAVWVEDDGSGNTPGGGNQPSVPTAKTYKLSYVTNTDMTIADQKSNTGSFTVTRRTPEKEGFVFAGWSLDENAGKASEVDYFAGDVFPAQKDVTLYGVFVPKKEAADYTITYDSKGGTEVAPTKAENGILMVTRRTPEKKGYVFAGWSLDYTAKDIDYIAGDKLGAVSDVKLYAVYVKVPEEKTYVLSYDTLGGTEVVDTEAIEGKFMVTRRTPLKDGKVFLGWSLYPDDTDIDYIAGDYVLADRNRTLYAVYTDAADAPEVQTYTITYDTRGGSSVAETKSYNGIFTVTRRQPDLDGKLFAGWTLDKDSVNPSNVDYTGGDTFPAEGDVTLYALYRDAVVVNTNGGSDVETTVTVIENKYIITITIPEKPGYDFSGWDTEGDGEANVDPDEPIETEDPSQPIDAVWQLKATPVMYVTDSNSLWLADEVWDADDTIGGNTSRMKEDGLVDLDGRAAFVIPKVSPVLRGSVFLGWSLEGPMQADGDTKVTLYQPGDTLYLDEMDLIYENGARFLAQWKADDTGENPGGDDKPTNPDDDKDPEKPGDNQGDGNKPGDDNKPGDGNQSGDGDKPGNDQNQGGKPGDIPNGGNTGTNPGTPNLFPNGNPGFVYTGPVMNGGTVNHFQNSGMILTGGSKFVNRSRIGGFSSGGSNGYSYAGQVKTGDTSDAAPYTLLLLASMLAMAVMLERKKRNDA